jgi:alkylation response protein AidB-like acyl-CoA dehydrogenase
MVLTVPADFTEATPAAFRDALGAWISDHRDGLTPPYRDHGTTDQLLAHLRRVQRLLYDDGWMRWGWPETVGGLGGTPLLRAVLGEELTALGLVHSAAWSMPEVLAPAVVRFAAPALAAAVIPPLLRGDELWCQGFSEPAAGSDLGSLRTAARSEGADWILSGQKVWTSWAHHATRCIVLARTEPEERGARGISAFFIDMDSPGIDVRPMRTMADVDEFCGVFFDDVHVPGERLIGGRAEGWAIAQHILACERGPIFWQRESWLLHHLGEVAASCATDDVIVRHALGDAYADIIALRARSRTTQHRVAAGDLAGAATSIDKVLIARADQSTFEATRRALAGAVELEDSPVADRFRKEWLYSRAATIYGGTAEIQRDIIGHRVLGLPRDA